MSAIKTEMKRGKQAHFASKIQELISKNLQCQSDNQSKQDKSNDEQLTDISAQIEEEDASASSKTLQDKSGEVTEISSVKDSDKPTNSEIDKLSDEPSNSVETESQQSEGKENSEVKDSVGAESESSGDSHEQGACAAVANVPVNKSVFTDFYKDSLLKLKKLMPESMTDMESKEPGSFSNVYPTFLSQILDLCKGVSGEIENLSKLVVDQVDQATQTGGHNSDCGKCVTQARDLCQTACHLLREIIIKIREIYANNGDEGPKLEQLESVSEAEISENSKSEDRTTESVDKDDKKDSEFCKLCCLILYY